MGSRLPWRSITTGFTHVRYSSVAVQLLSSPPPTRSGKKLLRDRTWDAPTYQLRGQDQEAGEMPWRLLKSVIQTQGIVHHLDRKNYCMTIASYRGRQLNGYRQNRKGLASSNTPPNIIVVRLWMHYQSSCKAHGWIDRTQETLSGTETVGRPSQVRGTTVGLAPTPQCPKSPSDFFARLAPEWNPELQMEWNHSFLP